MRRPNLTSKTKFLLIGLGFLAFAGILMLIVALILGWDIGAFFVHPVTIICYVFLVCGGVTIGAYFINKKIKGD